MLSQPQGATKRCQGKEFRVSGDGVGDETARDAALESFRSCPWMSTVGHACRLKRVCLHSKNVEVDVASQEQLER